MLLPQAVPCHMNYIASVPPPEYTCGRSFCNEPLDKERNIYACIISHHLSRLAELQQMSIGIAEEAATLAAPVTRRRQEDRPARFEGFVSGVTIWYANSQFMGDDVGICRRRKWDCGFVFRGATAGDQIGT